MKAIWKGLIAGAVVFVIGVAILITSLAVSGWTVKAKFTMETFVAEYDDTSVKLNLDTSVLKTEFYDGEKIEISYPVRKGFETEITERDGTLTFESKNKWFFQFFNYPKIPETVVKLPKDKVFDLDIDAGAGTVRLADGDYGNIAIDMGAGTMTADKISSSKFYCNVSTGMIDISSLSCTDITAEVSAGMLSLGVSGVKSEYTISASVSAGECNVSNQTGTTDKKLTVDCSAGSIKVKFILDE